VLKLITGSGARLVAIGAGAGLLASLLIARLMASLLFGIGPADPMTFLAVVLFLAAGHRGGDDARRTGRYRCYDRGDAPNVRRHHHGLVLEVDRAMTVIERIEVLSVGTALKTSRSAAEMPREARFWRAGP
jgi:hypothetical protein